MKISASISFFSLCGMFAYAFSDEGNATNLVIAFGFLSITTTIIALTLAIESNFKPAIQKFLEK